MFVMLIVNLGNYLYNLVLGRILGPQIFADTAILITLLLVLSFLGMTFQIATTKFTVTLQEDERKTLIVFFNKIAIALGLIIGSVFFLFSENFQKIFQTQTNTMFAIFGCVIPFYFLMSIKRGIEQGKSYFYNLSKSYLYEMLSRLIVTYVLLFIFPKSAVPNIVASGIFISIICGLFPYKKIELQNYFHNTKTSNWIKEVRLFFLITAFYEFTQIIINNSDIILVKHYFPNYEAGLYSSIALIGRVIYFVSWMFIMLLLPKVILLKKQGEETKSILFNYVFYIVVLSFVIIVFSALFSKEILLIMFGQKYLVIASILWKYALATTIFVIANLLTYYYLSINNYTPVFISALFGCIQVVLITLYHESLNQVVHVQILTMLFLLLFQVIYFLVHVRFKTIRTNNV
ncbi:capsular polysaccharide biosynthesis protein [Flavobacterium columnare ATCC 49512]|uniref:Capsular polysaccharide biosynthesis protein n=1 Tax=Flavobacterium columnare (strain ATCC 49512 / CIP 103533 / TG 44/87) TaxID=1041826 RepID=G8X8P7_FLACA|nr:capsular polysaccharide biosynthesis protein [Flavobacterium columnare ATCC 49512]